MSGQRTCSNCQKEMQDGQDWCLNCGQGAPSSARTGPGWRSAAAVGGSSLVLCLGAAAAAYAALRTSPATPAPSAVAQTPPATASTPPAAATTPAAEGAGSGAATAPTGTPQAESGGTQELPSTPVQPPKIPGKAQTPPPSSQTGGQEAGFPFGQAGQEGIGSGGKGATKATHGRPAGKKGAGNGGERKGGKGRSRTGQEREGEGEGSEEGGPESQRGQSEGGRGQEPPKYAVPAKKAPLLLDTNASHIYNPDHYPRELLGDPSLAIDGEVETEWTVAPRPEPQGKVNVGLMIDLHAAVRVAKVELITATPGMKVQIYGSARRHHLPHKLAGKRWVKLSPVHRLDRRKSAIFLKYTRHAFRHILIWIVAEPSQGTGKATAGSSSSTGTTTTSTTTSSSQTTSSPPAALSSSSSSYSLTTTGSATSSTQSTTTSGAEGGPGGELGISEVELYEPRPR